MRRLCVVLCVVRRRFQSSPGLEAGCDDSHRWPLRICLGVSILTRLGGRVRQASAGYSAGVWWFQSSPGLEAGCDQREIVGPMLARVVSILTRLGGRVRQFEGSDLMFVRLFQSSPGLEAGCDLGRWHR